MLTLAKMDGASFPGTLLPPSLIPLISTLSHGIHPHIHWLVDMNDRGKTTSYQSQRDLITTPGGT